MAVHQQDPPPTANTFQEPFEEQHKELKVLQNLQVSDRDSVGQTSRLHGGTSPRLQDLKVLLVQDCRTSMGQSCFSGATGTYRVINEGCWSRGSECVAVY